MRELGGSSRRRPFGALAILAAALGGAARADDVPPEAARARAVLHTHCFRCHGEKGTAEGGLNFVLDAERLRAKGLVRPGDPDASTLIRRIVDGEMPADLETTPDDDDVEALNAWVAAGAADLESAEPPRGFVTRAQVNQAIADDLDAQPPQRWPFLRYFTLTHLYNAGATEEALQTHRNALAKLVNSLSWGRRVVVPEPIDPARTVFRIDLRDLRWSNTVWNRIAAAGPYNLDPTTDAERAIARRIRARVARVRGDWFVATASRPPLYHEVLRLPEDVLELEERLGVPVARGIVEGTAVRAGFNGSGVSRNNRLIERHESMFGAYWKSYDFAANSGRQNLFALPLGPGADDRRFQHDGGEIIFSLPNGLQAYLLIDAHGRRIDKGPTQIVSDPSRPDRAVENGISCMGCHARGMIAKDDQVLAHFRRNPDAYTPIEREKIAALYPGPEAVAAVLAEDAARFAEAVARCGVPLTKTEPIITAAQAFEEALTLEAAAAEAEVEVEAFRAALAADPALGRALGSALVPGGTIQRDAFTAAFPTLAAALGRTWYSPQVAAPPTPERPTGLDDGALLFSPQALREAREILDRLKAETGLDIAIVTHADIPDADYPAFEPLDAAGRSAYLSRLNAATRDALKPRGFTLVIVIDHGQGHWSLSQSGIRRNDQYRALLDAVRPHFRSYEWDAGLRVLVHLAEARLREEAAAP